VSRRPFVIVSLFALVVGLGATPAQARGAHIAPIRIDVAASCAHGPTVDVTMSNPGRHRLNIWDVHLRLTPVQPGPGGMGVEIFILLTPDASRLSPSESASFGVALRGYDLPGKRLLVDVAVFLIGRHRPATVRVTTEGCGRERPQRFVS
jgi:hypothetical protein